MMPYGTDYTCPHGEPPGHCSADSCTHNPDTAYLAELDAEQEAKRQAEEHAQKVTAVADRLRIRAEAEAALRAAHQPPMPELVRLDELLARPVEAVRFRIDRLWPVRGRVVLSAQAKTGKTTLRDNTVRVLVDGGKFLDRYDVDPVPGTVGVLDTEMAEDTIQRWLREQGVRDDTRVWVACLRGRVAAFDVLDEQRRGQWAAVLRARDIKVLILDCLGPVLAVFGLDESKGVDVGRWLAAFEQLLDQAGVDEALVIHHMGHDGERSRGASRLRDWPDAEWKLMRAKDNGDDEHPDTARYFAAVGRDVDEPEGALRYDPMDRHLSLTGGSRSMAQAERDAPLVVEWVRQHPDSSSSEIDKAADGIGISRNRCRKARRAALRRGDLCIHPAARSRENHRIRAECAEHAAVRHPEPAHSQADLWE